jgi:RNAse (barnase) inhibitor barstar
VWKKIKGKLVSVIAVVEDFGDRFIHDIRAKVAMIAVVWDVVMVTIFLPLAITYINNTNVTGWDTTAATFYQTYLPLLLVIGVVASIVLPLIPRGKKGI